MLTFFGITEISRRWIKAPFYQSVTDIFVKYFPRGEDINEKNAAQGQERESTKDSVLRRMTIKQRVTTRPNLSRYDGIRFHIKQRSMIYVFQASPPGSVGSVKDLRTDGRWFDPRLGQFIFED